MQGADLRHAQAGMAVVEILDGEDKTVSPGLQNLSRAVGPGLQGAKPVPGHFERRRRFFVVIRIDAGQDRQGTFDTVDLRKADQKCVERWGEPGGYLIVPGMLGWEELSLHHLAGEDLLGHRVLSEDVPTLRERR
ncbi:hypothetical protein [Bradyrhizobium sp. 143]|uniref:hypothetical protein n=1 Tax=Bradyrhizobium sp. 143 TaxID=2782619 RepID=UPI001FFA0381|nr:hypothetical protein [Bradyrhizobium sp. 143]